MRTLECRTSALSGPGHLRPQYPLPRKLSLWTTVPGPNHNPKTVLLVIMFIKYDVIHHSGTTLRVTVSLEEHPSLKAISCTKTGAEWCSRCREQMSGVGQVSGGKCPDIATLASFLPGGCVLHHSVIPAAVGLPVRFD